MISIRYGGSTKPSQGSCANGDCQRRTKDLDQIQLVDLDPKHRAALEAQPLDVDLPGLGQHYCVECARYFETDVALTGHWKTKVVSDRDSMTWTNVLIFISE